MDNAAMQATDATADREHSVESLKADLLGLGVEAGDVLFVHASFKSVGQVQGGAGAIIDAFEQVLGDRGTLLMPSFNLVPGEQRAATWDLDSSPATTGWLTEYFRQMPGTMRSDHYSHSVAARGHRARWFTKGHLSREGMRSPWDLSPWGAAYGVNSPMLRAYDAKGKILKLGTDYNTSTYLHVVEVRHWNAALRSDAYAEYYWADRPRLGERFDAQGQLARGRVGDADCRLIPIQPYVETCLKWVTGEPGEYFKWYR